jgi:hypothetical protein
MTNTNERTKMHNTVENYHALDAALLEEYAKMYGDGQYASAYIAGLLEVIVVDLVTGSEFDQQHAKKRVLEIIERGQKYLGNQTIGAEKNGN